MPLTPSESLAPPPVHETVMDAWTNIRSHLEEQATDGSMRVALADFQGQLRKLCEQDHAQRTRLASRRYRLVDKLNAFFRGTR